MGRFPESGLDDGETVLLREFKDQASDILCGGILIQQVHWLVQLSEDWHHRVVPPEDHAMVQVIVDPAGHDLLDIREVDHHPSLIKFFRCNLDDCPTVMAMQVFTFAFVVQEPMAVAKVDFAGNMEHFQPVRWSKEGSGVLTELTLAGGQELL